MPDQHVNSIFSGAKSLSGSPLGIIALFILLVYGFAALTFGISVTHLGEDRPIIVWFLVLFPVLVLLVFTILVIFFHTHLYSPSDFVDQKDFLILQDKLERSRKENAILKEASNVVLPTSLTEPKEFSASVLKKALPSASLRNDDPQKGRWGGQPVSNGYEVMVGQVRPLKHDPDYYKVPIRVVSLDPQNRPLAGKVRFHLHPTFRPSVREVKVINGVAELELIAWGAFTVGVETEDGTKLEIDLSEDYIDASEDFKTK